MNKNPEAIKNNKWIVSNRGEKNLVDPFRPYGWMVEKERTITGEIEDTAIIFLSNKECSFHCLMCDLWKNTTDKTVPIGAIPKQIEWALSQMPIVKHIKLYNSGSFFDEKAIPVADYKQIALLLENFETVIVESHPNLITEKCLRFRDMLKSELHIAVGLETVHPEVLLKLNKQMTLQDFSQAIHFLSQNDIPSRAFILLRPPFLSEEEGVFWAKKSIDFAIGSGVECCTIIPVRSGNGAMDILIENGDFEAPTIHSLEEVLAYGIQQQAGRVFADVWDLELFSDCSKCLGERTDRLTFMNVTQTISDVVTCDCYP